MINRGALEDLCEDNVGALPRPSLHAGATPGLHKCLSGQSFALCISFQKNSFGSQELPGLELPGKILEIPPPAGTHWERASELTGAAMGTPSLLTSRGGHCVF